MKKKMGVAPMIQSSSSFALTSGRPRYARIFGLKFLHAIRGSVALNRSMEDHICLPMITCSIAFLALDCVDHPEFQKFLREHTTGPAGVVAMIWKPLLNVLSIKTLSRVGDLSETRY